MVGTILRVICSMFDIDSDLFHINMLSHAPWTTQRIHQLQLSLLVGGFRYSTIYFHLYLGKISNLIDIFQMGWSHQPAQSLLVEVHMATQIWVFCATCTGSQDDFDKVLGLGCSEIETGSNCAWCMSLPMTSFTCQALRCSVFTELQRCVQAKCIWSQKPGEWRL